MVALNQIGLIKRNKLLCFFTNYLNILIWFLVIRFIVMEDRGFLLISLYAFSYGIGDILALNFADYLVKLGKRYNKEIKILKKLFKRKKRK